MPESPKPETGSQNSSAARRAGVMGWPVAHSLSPALHGYWLDQYGIDGAYEHIEVAPEDFAIRVRRLADDGFAGANVTVPHKEAALRAVDEVDGVARRIGAVNTIVVGPDGVLLGSNTDAFGFMENLKAGASGWQPEAGPAAVLGAGGAARAVVAALTDAGAPEIRLLNRTRSRAETLAEEVGGPVTVADWDGRAGGLSGVNLLVNTTTLGMTGKHPLELDLSALPPEALVNDIVYAPLETDLLAAAAARGNPVVDGLGMLLHQARPGFAAWFGREPEVTQGLRDHLLAKIGG